jgi:uncharacterized Fe-S cluster protein YjdI/CDGSH-type Zn-finger protein
LNGREIVDQPARTYENDDIAVDWYPERCIHSARCVAGLPDVFDPRRKPWIVLEDHTADQIAAVVERCPTGALHYRRKDGGADESAPPEATIVVVRDGPLLARGDVTVADQDGTLVRRDTRMALCRCGHSAHRPFCDNTHRRIGFRAGAATGESISPTTPPTTPDDGTSDA